MKKDWKNFICIGNRENREREMEVLQLTSVAKTRNNNPIPISVMNKSESKGFKF